MPAPTDLLSHTHSHTHTHTHTPVRTRPVSGSGKKQHHLFQLSYRQSSNYLSHITKLDWLICKTILSNSSHRFIIKFIHKQNASGPMLPSYKDSEKDLVNHYKKNVLRLHKLAESFHYSHNFNNIFRKKSPLANL